MTENHKCGGTIIASRHILSAAHCFCRDAMDCIKPFDFEVVLGTIKSDSEGGLIFDIERIFIPADYTKETDTFDIAVAKVVFMW